MVTGTPELPEVSRKLMICAVSSLPYRCSSHKEPRYDTLPVF